jgi:hypothetical protein
MKKIFFQNKEQRQRETVLLLFEKGCALAPYLHGKQGSNPRPVVLETAALPAELFPCI